MAGALFRTAVIVQDAAAIMRFARWALVSGSPPDCQIIFRKFLLHHCVISILIGSAHLLPFWDITC